MGTYAVTDLHGQGWAWDAVKARLKPEDHLFFLGDAIDRGPDGVRIMQELLVRPNTTYLMGNHEQMMLDALYLTNSPHAMQLWNYNGGRATQKALALLPFEEVVDIMQAVCKLPLRAEYTNPAGIHFVMTHSGVSEYDYENPECLTEQDFLWDREHYCSHVEIPEDVRILHGHTPVPYLCKDGAGEEEKELSWYSYNDDKKIDIDLGVHFTEVTCLFDLDVVGGEMIDEDTCINS